MHCLMMKKLERDISSKDFSHKKDEVTKQVLTSNVESYSFVGGLESVDLGFCTPWDSKYSIKNKKPKDLVVDSPLFQ